MISPIGLHLCICQYVYYTHLLYSVPSISNKWEEQSLKTKPYVQCKRLMFGGNFLNMELRWSTTSIATAQSRSNGAYTISNDYMALDWHDEERELLQDTELNIGQDWSLLQVRAIKFQYHWAYKAGSTKWIIEGLQDYQIAMGDNACKKLCHAVLF